MPEPVVLKTDPSLISLSTEHRALLSCAALRLVERPCLTEKELIAHSADADALMVIAEPLTERVLSALRDCRIVARFGVGLDNIDLDVATRLGLQVTLRARRIGR
jgi:D-3-phosphoglycerate dehydrogenase